MKQRQKGLAVDKGSETMTKVTSRAFSKHAYGGNYEINQLVSCESKYCGNFALS